jgi:hypothetical protein
MQGDQVNLHGERGEVEVVAEPLTKDPLALWHLDHDGPGVLIREPKVYGRIFFGPAGHDWQDLSLVSRKINRST